MTKMQYFEPFPGNRGDELGNMASYRTHPHRGNDWGKLKGIELQPIKAMTNGRIKKIFWSDVLGNCVVQSTGDGVYVLYAHMAKPCALALNSVLDGGKTVIGVVGGGAKTPSGSASTGAHLHTAMAPIEFGLDLHMVDASHLLDVFKHIDANKVAA
jgi:murein DD-endopeptidase MepM/ murein hydrolase activator NlpD